jgi:peptidoglycan-associated lipoprotein
MRVRAVITMLAIVCVVAGCAKRPNTTGASAPAPTGGATAMAPTPSGPPTATPAPRPQPKDFRAVAELADIHFDFDKADIRPDAKPVLDKSATWLRGNAKELVLIEGHCDERGTNEYNLALGERRAKATMTYLVNNGVDARRITIISYGEERPECKDKTEKCWAMNRRAHFLTKSE